MLAAVVFMLWPPLLATVYVRGALAEALFMALVPWALWGVCRLQVQGQVASASVTGHVAVVAGCCWLRALFWTQAGLALWATALLLVWALWPGGVASSRLAQRWRWLAGALLGGGLFLLLHGGRATGTGPALDMAAHAVYPYQLFLAAWGFGVSTPGWQDGLPLQLGFAALGLAALTVVLGFGNRTHSGQAPGSRASRFVHAWLSPASPRWSSSC